MPLVAVLVVMVGGLCLVLGRLGAEAVASARARTAADAAALAAAAEGEEAAREVAAANGAVLEAVGRRGDEVQVEVRVGRRRVAARAVGVGGGGLGPPGTGGPGAGRAAGRGGLTAELTAALASAEAVLGRSIPITSGYRSPAQQQALWDRRATNPYPVARPGTSAHERGQAVDVPLAIARRLAEVGPSVGLCAPMPRTDPVHFESCPPRS